MLHDPEVAAAAVSGPDGIVTVDPVANRSCAAVLNEQWNRQGRPRSALVRMLCVVVADSSTTAQQQVLTNMRAFGALPLWIHTDWAVLTLDDAEATWSDTRWRSASIRGRLGVCDGGKRDGTFHPKLIFQLSVLSVASAFDAIYLLDADIAFTPASTRAFFHDWLCLHEGGWPIIAQATTTPDAGSEWWPLRHTTWGDVRRRGVRAVQVPFTEQQAVRRTPLCPSGALCVSPCDYEHRLSRRWSQ